MASTKPMSPAIRRLILTISVSVITVMGAGYGARLASGDVKTEGKRHTHERQPNGVLAELADVRARLVDQRDGLLKKIELLERKRDESEPRGG